MSDGVKIGFVVGSLRDGSASKALATAASGLLPDGDGVVIDGLNLPNYDDALESALPADVSEWRTQVASLDGLVFVTPEYNALPSGVIKNAIDWASRPWGAAPIAGKPVAVLGASVSPNGALWAQQAVLKSVPIAGAVPFEGEPVPVGPADEKLGNGGFTDAELEGRVRAYLDEFLKHVEAHSA